MGRAPMVAELSHEDFARHARSLIAGRGAGATFDCPAGVYLSLWEAYTRLQGQLLDATMTAEAKESLDVLVSGT